MDRSFVLRLLLIIEIIALLCTAAAISRDYQDSWILEGLEIPFATFMITYAIYVFAEKEITWIIAFSVLCRAVILAIPNLKYPWFQGYAIDQHTHYRLALDIYDQGYIPGGRLYSETPLMHLSMAIFSLITDVPVLHSFKYWPILSWSVYPLVVYLLMKNLETTKNSSLLRYALLISSLPVERSTSYMVVGTLIGALLSFLVLSYLIKSFQKRDQRDWIVVFVFGVALILAHSFSAVILPITLFAIYLMISFFKPISRNFTQLQLKSFFTTSLLFLTLNMAWLSHEATYILERIMDAAVPYMSRIMGVYVNVKEPVPLRFFDVISTDPVQGFKVTLIYYGGDIFLLFLMAVGVVLVARKAVPQSRSLVFFSLHALLLCSLLTLGLVTGFGAGLFYDRMLRFLLTIAPIFSCISLVYIDKKLRGVKLSALIILALMVLATIELYGCQPLMPPASLISKDLPTDEPIGYVLSINSIYQRRMIEHAERYIPQGTFSFPSMRIASDWVTRNQILGLTSCDFWRGIAWYYPFSRLLDKSIIERKYGYFLIHLPGKSGGFRESAEIRTRTLITKAIYNSSVVYTNGQSYMLTEPFMYADLFPTS